MALVERDELQGKITGRGRLLAVDAGEKTLGLALSDESQLIASPLKTISRKNMKHDAQALLAVIAEFNVVAICFGLPVHMNGQEGERAQWVRRFAGKIAELTEIPICFWDERWSTKAVEHTMLTANLSRQRRAELVDKLAACYILQGFLDWIRLRPSA